MMSWFMYPSDVLFIFSSLPLLLISHNLHILFPPPQNLFQFPIIYLTLLFKLFILCMTYIKKCNVFHASLALFSQDACIFYKYPKFTAKCHFIVQIQPTSLSTCLLKIIINSDTTCVTLGFFQYILERQQNTRQYPSSVSEEHSPLEP